jgi:release factor glutamine methyltransferase
VTSTLAALVHEAANRLRDRQTPGQNAALDAEVLARHVLGWDRAHWLAENRAQPPAGFEQRFHQLLERRLQGEPVAYLTGTREFWGLDFEVTPAVLIPRPETEILVEEALKAIDRMAAHRNRPSDRSPLVVADVGTGSGCIAVALAHSRTSIRVIATDLSKAALDVARRNAARHGVADRIQFVETPVLQGVNAIDLVVSNPPYIPEADAGSLMRDVVGHEPHTALFSSGEGLDVTRALLDDVAKRNPRPPVLLEFGGNERALRDAVEAAGLRVIEIVPDLAGIPRVARVEG